MGFLEAFKTGIESDNKANNVKVACYVYEKQEVVDHIKNLFSTSKAYGVSNSKIKLRKWLSRNTHAEFCSL